MTLSSLRRLVAPLGAAACLALTPAVAHAWFFFLIPGSVTSAIADKLSGAEGDNCVAETARVGDTITVISGNTGVIKSLSGTSSRCTNKNLPIRALIDLSYTYKASATLELPAGFVANPPSVTQRWEGISARAENRANQTGVLLLSRKRTPRFDASAAAHQYSENLSRALDDVKIENQDTPVINGLKAIRYELAGKSRAGIGRTFTYLVTVLEGDEEIVIVSAYAAQADFPGERETLRKLASGVRGLVVTPRPADDGPKDAATAPPPAVPPAPDVPASPAASAPAAIPPAAPARQAPQADKAGDTADAAPAPTAPAAPSPGSASSSSAIGSKLRELESLRRDGILSQTEFDAKKAELLKAF